MRLGVLFSGGKDSTLAAWIAKKEKYELGCFISVKSKNPDSYMFHTPAIDLVNMQAKAAGIPLVAVETKGEKEKELDDLKAAIEAAALKYSIEGVVTGAVESVYQATRVQKICNELEIWCFNPLWLMDQVKLLEKMIDEKFSVVISAVAAYPLDTRWVGKKIDRKFIEDITKLGINPAGEGGEFESLVIECPLFKIKLPDYKVTGEGNAYRMIL